jgi:hypothetical protein
MMKSIALIHLMLWGGLLLGGLFRVPEQFQRLMIHRTVELPIWCDAAIVYATPPPPNAPTCTPKGEETP